MKRKISKSQRAQTRAILKLPAKHRLALTGTPVENRLLDLWSILTFSILAIWAKKLSSASSLKFQFKRQ